MRERWFALHWRLRDFRLRPRVADFLEIAGRVPWLNEAIVRELPLVDGDLAIRGQRIDRAPADLVDTASSIAAERHLAINWLCDGPELYSEADTST